VTKTTEGSRRSRYLRAVGFERPSRSVVLATALASVALAAGGYLLGSRSEEPVIPAAVPFAPSDPQTAGRTILVPLPLPLPKR
jgi:hypothetical protein